MRRSRDGYAFCPLYSADSEQRKARSTEAPRRKGMLPPRGRTAQPAFRVPLQVPAQWRGWWRICRPSPYPCPQSGTSVTALHRPKLGHLGECAPPRQRPADATAVSQASPTSPLPPEVQEAMAASRKVQGSPRCPPAPDGTGRAALGGTTRADHAAPVDMGGGVIRAVAGLGDSSSRRHALGRVCGALSLACGSGARPILTAGVILQKAFSLTHFFITCRPPIACAIMACCATVRLGLYSQRIMYKEVKDG